MPQPLSLYPLREWCTFLPHGCSKISHYMPWYERHYFLLNRSEVCSSSKPLRSLYFYFNILNFGRRSNASTVIGAFNWEENDATVICIHIWNELPVLWWWSWECVFMLLFRYLLILDTDGELFQRWEPWRACCWSGPHPFTSVPTCWSSRILNQSMTFTHRLAQCASSMWCISHPDCITIVR